jgi:lysophospholipase L1-like esterase
MSRPQVPLILFALTVQALFNHAASDSSSARWESEIRAFEAADQTNAPPPGGVVFVGSSSIRLWKTLADDFKGLPVLNRGFGGSQLADSVFYTGRIVIPYRPQQIVLYAGDNDLAAGKSPEQVFHDFEAFITKVRSALPGARISYVSIKPSPARLALLPQMRAANALIAEFIHTGRDLDYIDVFTPMMREDGQPRPEIFGPDRLHMNAQGYALWTRLIRPHLLP